MRSPPLPAPLLEEWRIAGFSHQIQPTRILLVDDDSVDVKFLRHFLEHEPERTAELVVVENGDEAIAYLLSPDAPKPDLVIVDLNLPKQDGSEMLTVIRITDGFGHGEPDRVSADGQP